jgi:hypothetical protein
VQQLLTNVLLEQELALALKCQMEVCLWAEEGGAAYTRHHTNLAVQDSAHTATHPDSNTPPPTSTQHTLTLPQPLNQPSPHHEKHTVALRQKLGGRKLGGRKNPLSSKVNVAPPPPRPLGPHERCMQYQASSQS